MKNDMKLSDQVIGHIRELLQLSLLTSTNFVDRCRAVKVETKDDVVFLSKEYVEGWNKMITDMNNEVISKGDFSNTKGESN